MVNNLPDGNSNLPSQWNLLPPSSQNISIYMYSLSVKNGVGATILKEGALDLHFSMVINIENHLRVCDEGSELTRRMCNYGSNSYVT